MNIPLNWLRDYVDIILPPAQLIERLTLAGLEVAGARVIGLPIADGVKAEERVLKEPRPAKGRGVPSDAMVCSYRELGISDEHEGIILLEDDAPVGTPLADFMGEIVLEIDVLPNMARCLSLIGVAREVAAITGQQLRLPAMNMTGGEEAIAGQVSVEIV